MLIQATTSCCPKSSQARSGSAWLGLAWPQLALSKHENRISCAPYNTIFMKTSDKSLNFMTETKKPTATTTITSLTIRIWLHCNQFCGGPLTSRRTPAAATNRLVIFWPLSVGGSDIIFIVQKPKGVCDLS